MKTSHSALRSDVDDAGCEAQRALRSHPRREHLKSRVRSAVQARFEALQFRFDVFPRLSYQPLPWLGRMESGRAEGSFDRWNAIRPIVRDLPVASAIDVGCEVGFFSISLAEMGVNTLAIDIDERCLRIAGYTAKRARVDNLGLCQMRVDQQSVVLLPQVDAVLALSVWHHWVYAYGLEGASEILRTVWERCGKVLFFETGENEMPPEFGLPEMGDVAEDWIADYLGTTCAGSKVTALGRFKAFGVGGNEEHNVAYRTLFAVGR